MTLLHGPPSGTRRPTMIRLRVRRLAFGVWGSAVGGLGRSRPRPRFRARHATAYGMPGTSPNDRKEQIGLMC